ncbi:MAG: hypothetical protein EA350_09310 [Gemmatimonadales bacterium]|nr:MAG: hypothetical protein EA350_09310 [Gemmatimonadales bacterium]
MISELGGAPGVGARKPAASLAGASAGPGGAMGRDEFLQLLVAQLRNQDPLEPMKGEEFAAQLAQFAQVEQLTSLNAHAEAQLEATYLLATAQNNSAALNAIGREILAAGNGVTVPEDGPVHVTVGVGGAGGMGTLILYDSAGREVAREELGYLPAGRRDILAEGTVTDLPPGNYTYAVLVEGENGNAVETRTFTRAMVDGIRYGKDGPVLMAAGAEIPLGSVVEILNPRDRDRD